MLKGLKFLQLYVCYVHDQITLKELFQRNYIKNKILTP